MGMLRKSGVIAESTGQVAAKYRIQSGSLTEVISNIPETRNISVNFKPALVHVYASLDGAVPASWGMGIDAATEKCMIQKYDGAMSENTAFILYIWQALNDIVAADAINVSATGFSLSFTKSGTPSGNINILWFALG